MRVAVIGAGAIGGTIAGLLARAGHEVQVVARGEQLAALADTGLRLTGGWGDFTVRVDAVEALTISPDIAFLTTKAQDAAVALRANAELLIGIPVVVVQNGLEAITTAKRAAPRSDIVGGLALYAASYLSPGTITITTTGPTFLGGPVLPALYASKILGAVMPVELTDNFEGAQWTKLIVNHVNGLSAATGLSVQEVIGNRDLRAIMTETMREAVRVARAAGIEFASLQGLSHSRLTAFARVPPVIAQLLPLLMKRRMGSRPNPGSTLQSIRRGQPTEIDYLNGAVVLRGEAVGVAVPVSAELVAMVHEVERAGEFLPVATVIDRMTVPLAR
ncbi:2-dehydropantoate 2-reductase [Glaciihabitans sp. INWT7]|uniref:ketopantoate reductase family protein n=1 Tax=Glaciihabitans sp. INWT7 TaxID=2596912 RepID=UPI001627245E|nr:2-dehydropantoate 2-reductase [Glaciihabitans sp. INWT7]QNE46468.1 2-dehydropantoate 2-reductase [Glaciihabitans sp. INWT7]